MATAVSNAIHVKVLLNSFDKLPLWVLFSRGRPGFGRVMGLTVFYSRTFLYHLL